MGAYAAIVVNVTAVGDAVPRAATPHSVDRD
jgi:hypothetical protein